jgi:Family of unknown function (DUF5678)
MGIAEHAQAEEEFGVKLMAYAGLWVAVAERTVVESASTLDELLERVEGQHRRVEVFRVAKHPDAACFF